MRYKALAAGLIATLVTLSAAAPATARDAIWPYANKDVRGQWVFSADLKFAAPAPLPGTLLDGAPPHAMFQPGDKISFWGSYLGTMDFDGDGNVTTVKDVFKVGEVEPSAPFPLPFIPPAPEVGKGSYTVNPDGTVEIAIAGRSPGNPEDQVDFEASFHCQLNRYPREMLCVIARFTTYFVDPTGYDAPIAGIVTFRKRY